MDKMTINTIAFKKFSVFVDMLTDENCKHQVYEPSADGLDFLDNPGGFRDANETEISSVKTELLATAKNILEKTPQVVIGKNFAAVVANMVSESAKNVAEIIAGGNEYVKKDLFAGEYK